MCVCVCVCVCGCVLLRACVVVHNDNTGTTTTTTTTTTTLWWGSTIVVLVGYCSSSTRGCSAAGAAAGRRLGQQQAVRARRRRASARGGAAHPLAPPRCFVLVPTRVPPGVPGRIREYAAGGGAGRRRQRHAEGGAAPPPHRRLNARGRPSFGTLYPSLREHTPSKCGFAACAARRARLRRRPLEHAHPQATMRGRHTAWLPIEPSCHSSTRRVTNEYPLGY